MSGMSSFKLPWWAELGFKSIQEAENCLQKARLAVREGTIKRKRLKYQGEPLSQFMGSQEYSNMQVEKYNGVNQSFSQWSNPK